MLNNVVPIAVAGLIIMVLGTILHLIGTGGSRWTSVVALGKPDYSHGLFQECIDGQCEDIGDDFRYDRDAVKAAAALAVTGAIAATLSTLICVVSLFLLTCVRPFKLKLVITALGVIIAFAATVCIVLSIIIHATAVFEDDGPYSHLSTSFVMACIGGVMLTVGAFLFAGGAVLIHKDRQEAAANDKLPLEYPEEKTNPLHAMYVPPAY